MPPLTSTFLNEVVACLFLPGYSSAYDQTSESSQTNLRVNPAVEAAVASQMMMVNQRPVPEQLQTTSREDKDTVRIAFVCVCVINKIDWSADLVIFIVLLSSSLPSPLCLLSLSLTLSLPFSLSLSLSLPPPLVLFSI